MPKYGRKGFKSGAKPYFKSKCSSKPTARMAKYIRSIVSASTAMAVSYPRTDPPSFKAERTMRRRVRVIPAGTATGMNTNTIAVTEAGYYSKDEQGATARWNYCKVLALTCYGKEDVDEPLMQIRTLNAPNSAVSDEVIPCTYQDAGDKNHRACIKLIYPPTQNALVVTQADNLIAFAAGSVAYIDCYVEFS